VLGELRAEDFRKPGGGEPMTPATDSLQARARKLAAHLGSLSEEQRTAMAARMPTVCNPDGRFLTARNTLLLFEQCGRMDLTMVAGFRQWIDAGRCVRKGQHSIGCIMVPMSVKDKGPGGEVRKDENGEDKSLLRFRFVAVFDVSQTDEIPAREEGSAA
jgi:antirestriction protein ArdC